MSCEEIENRILDCQENQLSPAQREEVETHLAGCETCRMFARQLSQLDAALSVAVKVPALSDAFAKRLHERIQAAPMVLSETERGERKRQMQAEFEAGMAQIGWGSFALGGVLDQLKWPALAVLAGWLVWLLTPLLIAHFQIQSMAGLAPSVLPWLAASVIFVVVGLAAVLPRQWRLLRGW